MIFRRLAHLPMGGFPSRIALVLQFGLLASTPAFGFPFSSDSRPVVETVPIEQGPIYSTVTASGRVISRHEIDLSARIPGAVSAFRCKQGDTVAKGAILALLDDRRARTQLDKAQAQLRQARQTLDRAADEVRQLRELFEAGAEPGQAVKQAEAELHQAQENEAIAQAELQAARIELADHTLTAPFSGTITRRLARETQWVTPGQPLLTLSDERNRAIEIKVDTADSAALRIGQEAIVSSDAFPGREWLERTISLDSAILQEGTVKTLTVYLSVESPQSPPLRLGQQVDVQVRVNGNPQALKVPFTALLRRDGKTLLAVVQNGIVHLVPVETGVEDLTHSEIRGAVHAGQRIAVVGDPPLKEGDAVRPANAAQP